MQSKRCRHLFLLQMERSAFAVDIKIVAKKKKKNCAAAINLLPSAGEHTVLVGQ